MKYLILASLLFAGCERLTGSDGAVAYLMGEVAVVDALIQVDIDEHPSLIDAPQSSPPEPPASQPPAAPAPDSVPLPKAGGELLSRIGDAIDEAAQPKPYLNPDWTAYLFTASWCAPCHTELAFVDEVSDKVSCPVTVLEVDTDKEAAKIAAKYKVNSYPTWIIVRPDKAYYRHVGAGSHAQVAKQAVPQVASFGGMLSPTVKVSDLMPLVAGKTYQLGDKATVTVPKDVKWTVAHKNGVTILSFSRKPTVIVHKIINWKVALDGVQITPTAIVIELDNMPDVTMNVDWSSP